MRNEKKLIKGRKPPGYNKRSEEQRDFDIAFCSNLFLRGYSYREIQKALADELKGRDANYTISVSMVFYDLKNTLIEWKRERLDNIDDYITQELRKLDKMETELWDAWENSKSLKERKKERSSKKPNKVNAEIEEPEYYGYSENATETSSGNPRFLDLLLNVQQRRAKLLGFDAPVKFEMGGVRPKDDAPRYDAKAIPEDLLFAVVDQMQNAAYIEAMENKGKPID